MNPRGESPVRQRTVRPVDLPFTVRPGVTTFGFRVLVDVEHFNVTLPDRLPLENLMDGRSANLASGTLVKVFDCQLQPLNVFASRHNARQAPQRSTGCFRRLQPALASCEAPVRLAEVVIREIECDRSFKVFELFAEGVREPRQSTAVHPQCVVLLVPARKKLYRL